MPHLPKGIKIYRKFRYHKGHGVHSPFSYNLITKVIEERSPYYAFDEIDHIRKTVFVQPDHPGHVESMHHAVYGELLFRLVNFFQSKCVLQIGSSEGFIALYIASARSGSKCVVVEESEARGRFTEEVIMQAGLKNIRIEIGSYFSKIQELFEKTSGFDFIFIHVPEDKLCRQVIKMCRIFTNKEVVIVISGINKNKTMKKMWQEIINDDKITVSIDLYALGIAILKENTHKQHYKTYFNNGKKQHLHKNRRQRFYFFGGGNKSSQNTPALRRLWNGR